MSKVIVPPGYRSLLDLYETQVAIGKLRYFFQDQLAERLNLKRVTAPLFVEPETGLNDDLDGKEKPVAFHVKETNSSAVVVHSLAKWKRLALQRYNFYPGNGIYTDMNAIRREETLDNLHSIYVDQWDWEQVIMPEKRSLDYLKQTAQTIADAIYKTAQYLNNKYSALEIEIKRQLKFITSQELEDLYPESSAKERENLFLKQHKAAMILQIGGKLRSGNRHDSRAPDYDDWSMNGDLFYWSDVLGCAVEMSSMGIRVDADTLEKQLKESGCEERRNLPFHRMLLEGKLPLTIGGGIGQSRLCMLLLKKAHIGEVQTSIWDERTKTACQTGGIFLL